MGGCKEQLRGKVAPASFLGYADPGIKPTKVRVGECQVLRSIEVRAGALGGAAMGQGNAFGSPG